MFVCIVVDFLTTVDGTVLDPCMVLDPFATFYNLARMTGMNARRQKRESEKNARTILRKYKKVGSIKNLEDDKVTL